MVHKLYPYGKKKAFNVTYDDGVLQDIRFVELLNQYGLKGTFNLNSALIENEFEWIHEKGCVVKRLKTDAVKSLYAGHEVASHTLNHPYMHDLSKEGVIWELAQDKRTLEALFGEEIKGFAVPFDYYSDLIEECVKECGFTYGRISEMSHSFRPQSDFYRWKATVFHCEERLESLTQQFLETEEELALFQIVGHSYDLDTENMWDRMENIFRIISGQDDVLPMTTIEIIEYLKAMEKAEITDQYIQNNSEISLWFAIDDMVCEVKPQERVMMATKMSEECLICKSKLEYLESDVWMECAICHKQEKSKARCVQGHYVCNECHTNGMDEILSVCLKESSRNPVEIMEKMMSMGFCHMHGPEHHVMVGAALLTAYKNAGGEMDLSSALIEMYSRGKQVPGGVCGFWGACGAGISTGIYMAIVTQSNPLAKEAWSLSNQMTASALHVIGQNGGPRCCKRDSYLAITEAVRFTKEKLGIQMEMNDIVCSRSELNNQCLQEKCLFNPKSIVKNGR